ncbi:hypothetical protein E5F05_01255 (plasmid) [Deinococcus metallilatus]|uniref:BACON domain-containing protein n=1 Tax=Deinococcus metallilatus TaxID=1211322 RepID=A0ABR6MNQ8_9DEIO|nr:hypothetical protein [Deinococcus metallilatus]MBB5293537.1 hypothetical protein [Deinococcus metallilatus]QBY06612.1 hypothetical protein E5F05_01255 [Deinococcus metallilatus]RXJ17955.1 hypothetical protein ERJ73_00865 [Deinococcus metallilatus]
MSPLPPTLEPLVLVAPVGQTARATLALPGWTDGTTSSVDTAPDWLTLTPVSDRQLTATATCGAAPETRVGQVTLRSTPPRPVTQVPVVLVCTAGAPAVVSPDPFTFPPVSGAVPGSTVTSEAVTLSGLTAAAPVKVQGGTLLVNGEARAGAAGTVQNGDRLQLRVQASNAYSTAVAAVATVGNTSGVFVVTTAPPPVQALAVTPNRLDFTGTPDALTLTVTRAGETAPITPGGTCAGIVSITPDQGRAPSATFTVTPLKAGTCVLVFQSGDQTATVPVTVTTTSVGLN